MTIPTTIIDDAVRRTLPATVRELRAATGVSEPTLHRHLTRLRLLGCVTRTAPRQGAADVWHEAPGATWKHLRDMGVSVG